mmetsp:Transcript_2071/g.6141  ORF Transcript_2071/g.6141 Transcript_2071/m.6141 type:complete len:292 (-) Transcript_2071:3708-4583(-)
MISVVALLPCEEELLASRQQVSSALCPMSTAAHLPPAGSHTRAVPSREAVTMASAGRAAATCPSPFPMVPPSDRTTTATIALRCPSSTAIVCPTAVSQTRAVPSAAPDTAVRPSWLRATAATGAKCPLRACRNRGCCARKPRSQTNASLPAAAAILPPSPETDTAVICFERPSGTSSPTWQRRPVAVSQSMAAPSSPTLTHRSPSGSNATAETLLLPWPHPYIDSPSCRLHSLEVMSLLTVNAFEPSGDTATPATRLLWPSSVVMHWPVVRSQMRAWRSTETVMAVVPLAP